MINGSFIVAEINRKYLFLRRIDNGLWDLLGGGYEVDEIDYRKVAVREAKEEGGIIIGPRDLQLCAILGQKLPQRVRDHYDGKIEYGSLYLHTYIHYTEPGKEFPITLGNEHSEYRLFTYDEIISEYKDFSSGPLWMFFTSLTYHQTKKVQEGMLYERRLWQGKAYIAPLVAAK
jgi:8-oxo-dGTP pyrophosphatase MutT (NUDIX family)